MSIKIPAQLARNGKHISASVFIDGGATLFGAISTALARKLSLTFDTPIEPLPHPVTPRAYDGRPGAPITHFIILTIVIDKRRINFPLVLTELGNSDVLLGGNFL